MERVAFLIEATNQRLGCLLNPESLTLRRQAGIVPRRSATGQLTGAGLADDPLLFTGGGRTELELDLLFDVALAGSSIASEDVRDLTGPLWRLAENSAGDDPAGRNSPPRVRFIWGKAWNIPGVVVAVAERLEHFTAAGVPRRSWLRLRLLRSEETVAARGASPRSMPVIPAPDALPVASDSLRVHARLGGPAGLDALPAPEPTLTQALVTSADLIAAAWDETPASAWLANACRDVLAAVDTSLQQVVEWVNAAGDSPALQAIRARLEEMGTAVRGVVDATKTAAVDLARRAAATVAAAAQSVAARVRQLAAPATAAVAAALQATMANVRPLARALARSAGLIAQAVRARAVRVIARLMPHLETGRARVAAALQRAGTWLTDAGAQAADTLRAAFDALAANLAQARSAGAPGALAAAGRALARVGGAIDALWTAGERRLARLLSRAVPQLAAGIKGVLEAGEAVAAVAGRSARAGIVGAAAALRDLLDGEPPALQSASDELVAQVEATTADLPAPQRAPVAAALSAVQAIVTRNQAPDAPEAAADARAELAPALETLTAALEEIDATEESATANQMAAALAPVVSDDAVTADASGAPLAEMSVRADFGERLDHLAQRYYGDAAYWRLLALVNGIDDPLRLPPGVALRIAPPLPGGTP